jgi:cytochrome P450
MLATAPGPRGLPLVGSLFDLARDPLEFVTATSRTFGGIARYRIGPETVFLLTDPDAIQALLVDGRDVCKDHVTAGLARILGTGLLTAEGDLWKRQRKLAAPSFQPRHLATYADAMVDATSSALGGWADGERDLHADFTAITLDIVLRTLFGASVVDGDAVGHAMADFMEAFEEELRSWRRLLPPAFSTAGRRRIDRAREALHVVVDRVIGERKADGGGDELLSRLLAARDEDGNAMSDAQLRDEVLTLFLAGHETTALTLSYAAHLLALHPDQQALVRAELAAELGGRRPTVADLPRLKRVDAVVRESMRLYPPAWLVGRTPTKDLVIQGVSMPAGSQVLASQWVVHRDPRFWRDADQFRPERWLSGETAALPRFAFFPFGGGPRVCIGNHFASMEAALVLATVLQRFSLAAAPGFELELMPAVTLRPRGGVRVRVTAEH